MTSKLALCLAAGLLLPASANAVLIWDDETAARREVIRPPNWAPETDCSVEITSARQGIAGTTASFDVYAVSVAAGAHSPAPSVSTWIYGPDGALLHQLQSAVSEEERMANLPAKLTYSSAEPATHDVFLYIPESLNYYYWFDPDTGEREFIGMRWCEGLTSIDWVPATNDTSGGKVTGGGWLEPRRKVFALTAQKKSAQPLPVGQFTYIDSTVDLRFRSTELTSLQTVGNTTLVQGKGELADGTTVGFTVQATDNGEPGTLDTLEVTIGSYHAAGALAGGNVQMH